MAALSAETLDPLGSSFVEGPVPFVAAGDVPRGHPVEFLRDDETQVELEATLARPGLVVLADSSVYSDAQRTPDGVKKLTLGSGVAGKAKIALSAKGDEIPLPALGSFTLPLRLQLQGNGRCWEAIYGTPQENTTAHFTALATGCTPPDVCPCGATGYPTCGGTCGAGEVCRPMSGDPVTLDPAGFCTCVPAGGATDCPTGTAFLTGDLTGTTPLGCAPIPTCLDVVSSGYPGCAGGVPPGAVCQPVRVIGVFGSADVDASVCVAYPDTQGCQGPPQCGGTGGVCPSGSVCLVSSFGGEGPGCGCM